MSPLSNGTSHSSPQRGATWLCTIAIVAVVGSLFATRERPFAPTQARRQQAAPVTIDTSLKPACTAMMGWNLKPQAIVYMSDATREAAQVAAEAEAKAAYEKLISATHWREAGAASERLAQIGSAALPYLLQGAEHSHREVSWHSRRQLKEVFPSDPTVVDFLIRSLGNKTADRGLRYESAFHLGQCHDNGATVALRKTLNEDPELRLTAAKSLAELGHKDAARILFESLSSDHYMERYQANLGFKALTGRDVNEAGYEWHENAFVSGGEYKHALRPIEDNEMRARRYQAIANYSKWLKAEHPEIYEQIDPAEQRRAKRRTASR